MGIDVINSFLPISKKLKVLLVEDHKETRDSILSMLESFFDNIVIGVDGSCGLELYRNNFYDTNTNFDIVISDIEMPNLNGIEMVKEIYKINSKQIILIISAYSDREYLIPLINIGVFGFIQKPFDFNKIIQVVANICKSFEKDYVVNLPDGYIYNKLEGVLIKDDTKIQLCSNEIKFLELFLNNKNRNFNLMDIFNHIFYDEPYKEFSSDSVKSLIKRFRKKIPDNLIVNHRTLGYKINLPS
jgi:DNA-binding response OmpR family regulator